MCELLRQMLRNPTTSTMLHAAHGIGFRASRGTGPRVQELGLRRPLCCPRYMKVKASIRQTPSLQPMQPPAAVPKETRSHWWPCKLSPSPSPSPPLCPCPRLFVCEENNIYMYNTCMHIHTRVYKCKNMYICTLHYLAVHYITVINMYIHIHVHK